MRPALILCFLLVAVTVGIFLPTGNHPFISFDDPGYVTENPRVRGGLTGENVGWAFSSTAMSNWHPLTWLSHMTDVQLFGLDPRGHHLTNVFFHVASTLLLFFLLSGITGSPWQSLFVAALFALHPLHVESVAWVAERKDVLSGCFWFLTLLLYARYVKRGGTGRYLLVLLSFAAGLMAKPMLVTLPVVLLLLDYWPLRRPLRWSLVKEKIPLFALSALSSAVTLYAQEQGGAINDIDRVPLHVRIGNSVVCWVKYVWKMFFPRDLAMLYPFPGSIPPWEVLGAFLLLVLVCALVVVYRRRCPYLVTGWFWFLFTLVPVIGIVQVGGQAMADRYTYLPLTGLFIACAWGVNDLLRGWRYRTAVLATLAGLIVAASAAVTWRQVGYWKDNLTLYRHTLEVTTGNYVIRNNYGVALAQEGRLDEAITQYREVLTIWPRAANAYINLGDAMAQQGNYPEAIRYYQQALRIEPDYALALENMGRSLTAMGRDDEAVAIFEQSITMEPSRSGAYLNLAILLVRRGRLEEGWRHYETALRLEPYSAKPPINMGAALGQRGLLEEAAGCFRQALRIAPDSVEAHFNLGVVLARQNRPEEAAQHFSEVLRLRPDSVPARRWMETLRQGPPSGKEGWR